MFSNCEASGVHLRASSSTVRHDLGEVGLEIDSRTILLLRMRDAVQILCARICSQLYLTKFRLEGKTLDN
jgi:hypothetical protein